MAEMILSLPESATDADYEAALDILLKELYVHETHMNQNRTEIEQLKAEAHTIGNHTDTVIANIWKQLDALRRVN